MRPIGTTSTIEKPENKLRRDGAFNELERLAQGSKKQTIKVTNTINSISPNKEPTKKNNPCLNCRQLSNTKIRPLSSSNNCCR